MLKRTKNLISKYKLTISRLRKKVEKLEQEKTDLYEIAVSTIADFENYKKRASRHQIKFKKFANQKLLQEIITVVDSIKEIPTYSNDGIAIDGVKMILKEITKIFKKFNVEPIEAVGKQFDPKFHQAISLEETDEYTNNTILSELQTGYMIHDRLLRPSMVVVSTLKKEN
jgi:molecular chaperone GrpE